MQKLLGKLARARKAIVGAATQIATLVVVFVPSDAHAAKVAVGLVGSVISLLLIYRVPNAKARR